MIKKGAGMVCAGLAALMLLSSCSRIDGSYYVKNKVFADFDLAGSLGLSFDSGDPSDTPVMEETEEREESPNYGVEKESFMMRAFDEIPVYAHIGDASPCVTIKRDEVIKLTDTGDDTWMIVSTSAGEELGYAKDGFMHAIDDDCTMYAELPIEYGRAHTYEGTDVDAYSHLVDIRKYFKVYESTRTSNKGVDLSQYDLKVSMKLSTNDTSIHEPFYSSNICMLQYDILPKLRQAINTFKADGYTVVIYDAYRPTSVQQRWFDVVRVHKWVADPSIGMGGVHDRGTAIDMSLIGPDGKELEMPTPMHTFTEASARDSKEMSEEARKNMDYMLNVMTACGFTYINSEWWHFQDVNTKYYLPTDHPIDNIPLIASEQ